MAVIKSGVTTDAWTIDPVSKAGRVTLYDSSGNPVTPAADHTTAANPESVRLTDGSAFYKATTPADTQPVSAALLPLPTGAATASNQTTANASLSSISTSVANIPASPAQDGTDGAAPPSIPGTGIRGWLRSIYDRLSGVLTIQDRDSQNLLGVFYYHGGVNLVQASADAATNGRFWLLNPIGSGVTVRVKSIEFASQLGSALAAATSPRLTMERVTFTGSPSGASLTPAKRKTADPNPLSTLRTASTGLTLTAGSVICSFLPIASATAVGYTNTAVEKWKPEIDDRIDLIPGEGIVCRQPDAGTTSDTRRYTVDITVEEF